MVLIWTDVLIVTRWQYDGPCMDGCYDWHKVTLGWS